MKTDARTTGFQAGRSDDSCTTDFQVRRSSPDGAISGDDDPRLPASLASCTTVFQDRRIGPADSCTTDFQVRRSSPDGPDSGHDDPRLAAAIDDYLKACEAGQPPDLEAFINQHAEIAAELRQCLAGLTFLQHAAPNIESSSAGIVNILNAPGGPPELLGDFRILREIGRGGMGVVYEAEQISLGRRVALKVLPFAAMLDQRQLQRFKNEARAAASLDHPNIVEVHAVGCERGVHFYAMRYVEGQTLAAVIETLRDQRSGVRGHVSEPACPQAGNDSVGNGLRAVPEAPQRAEFSPSDNSVPCTPYSVPAGNFALDSAELVASRTPHSELADHSPFPIRPSPFADTSAIAALSTLRTERPRDFYRTIAQLGIQAAEALDHAHQLGIVHRDIKPSNLMLESRMRNDECRLRNEAEIVQSSSIPHSPFATPHCPKLYITDFGLARIQADAGMTLTGDLLGTLRYMSPEQSEGKSAILDHRTDIYSLGVTLYELLTLRPAFPADDRQALLRQIADDEPTPPRKLNPAIPAELETVLLKAIAKDPAERYVTAREFVDDLGRFRDKRTIKARPPTVWQRVNKLVRRHQAVAISAFLALTLTTLGLAVSIMLISRERNDAIAARNDETIAKNEAEQERARAEATYLKARQAVDDLVARIAKNLYPPGEDIRLLEQALEFQKIFLHDRGTDLAGRNQTAHVYRRIAEIQTHIGQSDKAEHAWREAI
jgi:serine/threonine protein kinase